MKSIIVAVLLLTMHSSFAQEVVVIPPPPVWVQPPNPDANDLLRRGQRKRLAGALLMGIGGGLLLTGAGLAAWSFAVNDCGQFANTRSCTYNAGMWTGAVAMAVGFGGIIAGIPLYVVGNHQVKRARLALMPSLNGASLAGQF